MGHNSQWQKSLAQYSQRSPSQVSRLLILESEHGNQSRLNLTVLYAVPGFHNQHDLLEPSYAVADFLSWCRENRRDNKENKGSFASLCSQSEPINFFDIIPAHCSLSSHGSASTYLSLLWWSKTCGKRREVLRT